MDFADAEARGYVWKSNDPKNIELKFIMDTDLNGGFSVSQTAGKHSGDGCCSGFAYMINMECDTNPVEFRFRKEMWHVSYHTSPEGDFTHSKFNFRLNGHGNIGICFVKYVLEDAISNGHDAVALEFWANPDPDNDPENWIKVKRIIDNGGWGDDGDKCNGNDDQVGSWGMPKFRLKSNSSGSITFKHLSLREIDPTKDVDDDPDDPGTTPPVDQPNSPVTRKGSFKLQRDVNIQRTSPCSPAGLKSFFSTMVTTPDEDFEIADHATFHNHTKAGELCRNSESVMKGHILQQLDIKMRKVGTPGASPVVNAYIVDAGHVIRYTSTTNLNPTTLTTSFDTKSFDFSTNTRPFQTGDSVVIEYLGDSDDDYVEIGLVDSDPPSPNSQFTYYDKDEDEWIKQGGNDICATMYEDA